MLDERTAFWLTVCGGLLLAALAGWACWAVVRSGDPSQDANGTGRPKEFRRTLVENLSVTRHGVVGVEFVKCRACRLEKRKRGVLTLGGMNVLVLEDVSVVVPPNDVPALAAPSAGAPPPAGSAVAGSHAVLRRLGISDGFLASRGVPVRFSGVRIANLEVSRLAESNAVVLVFAARTAKAERGGLALSGCSLAGAVGKEVENARLGFSGDALRLVWEGGEMYIP